MITISYIMLKKILLIFLLSFRLSSFSLYGLKFLTILYTAKNFSYGDKFDSLIGFIKLFIFP